MQRYLLIIALILTACELNPTPTVATRIQNQVSPPTAAVSATKGQLPCGAESAITLAQTQSDLALAAVAKVEAIQKTTQDQIRIAKEGQTVFIIARDAMKAHAAPDCLATAKNFAIQFFDERVSAYTSLGAGNRAEFETHLNNGEVARQNMVNAVNKILVP